MIKEVSIGGGAKSIEIMVLSPDIPDTEVLIKTLAASKTLQEVGKMYSYVLKKNEDSIRQVVNQIQNP